MQHMKLLYLGIKCKEIPVWGGVTHLNQKFIESEGGGILSVYCKGC